MRLTAEERRRMFQAQQRANETMRVRPGAASPVPGRGIGSARTLRGVIRPATIVLLLGGGVLAFWALAVHPLNFHLPEALVEMLFPRL